MDALSFRPLRFKEVNPENALPISVDDAADTSLEPATMLIGAHCLLLGIWATGFEKQLTVALANEKLLSFLITTITTTFGTIYSAVLVFLTQTLATRRNLQRDQMITATHDTTIAWAGIGAAICRLWAQKTLPSRGSALSVLSVATYLAAVLGLHITSSSLFSLVSSNSTGTSGATTQGLPGAIGKFDVDQLMAYTSGSLAFLPSILTGAANQGLSGGTLYEVPDSISSVPGNTTVNARGFDLTCGYLPVPTSLSPQDGVYSLNLSKESAELQAWISTTQPGMTSTASVMLEIEPGILRFPEVVFYSTIPIVDSAGNQGSLVELSPPMNTSVSALQIFRCALTLVRQIVILDSQTQQILSVEPGLTKTTSTWQPYTVTSEFELEGLWYPNATDNMLINLWETWYQGIPTSHFLLDYSFSNGESGFASIGDVYLIQKLNMPAANHSDTRNITLHDFENALSTVVASIFWTRHVQPFYNPNFNGSTFANGTITDYLNNVSSSIALLPGNADITEVFAETELQLSIIAVSAGLVVSIVLIVVALPLLRASEFDKDLPMNGTGILHTIWLYHNHPDLQELMEHVEHPTDQNLRAAGMVRTRLIGEGLYEKTPESI
ncbi:hypothetical protein C8R45DRAFT_1221510 [Mycena sanguinolenta]|nr:hypothetical protein C8R45DRAFT_1221510 [Mycena sanguinolenta]